MRAHAPISVKRATERLREQSDVIDATPGDDAATVSVSSPKFQEQTTLYDQESALPARHAAHTLDQGDLAESPELWHILFRRVPLRFALRAP